jgi:Lrp/AsnC family transcriptional regulator, leucine-responsive regulatory protein
MVENKKEMLDEIDKKILEALDADARISLKKMGRELGISHTTMYNHLNKLLELKIIHSFTIVVDPDFIDSKTIQFLEIHTIKSDNPELDKVTTKAFADYLMTVYKKNIIYCSLSENRRIYLIIQLMNKEDEKKLLNDLKTNKTFVEDFIVNKDNKILEGFRLFEYNRSKNPQRI